MILFFYFIFYQTMEAQRDYLRQCYINLLSYTRTDENEETLKESIKEYVENIRSFIDNEVIQDDTENYEEYWKQILKVSTPENIHYLFENLKNDGFAFILLPIATMENNELARAISNYIVERANLKDEGSNVMFDLIEPYIGDWDALKVFLEKLWSKYPQQKIPAIIAKTNKVSYDEVGKAITFWFGLRYKKRNNIDFNEYFYDQLFRFGTKGQLELVINLLSDYYRSIEGSIREIVAQGKLNYDINYVLPADAKDKFRYLLKLTNYSILYYISKFPNSGCSLHPVIDEIRMEFEETKL